MTKARRMRRITCSCLDTNLQAILQSQDERGSGGLSKLKIVCNNSLVIEQYQPNRPDFIPIGNISR